MFSLLISALSTSLIMIWEVFWPLALGFLLSAIIQALVSNKALAKVLGSDNLKSYSLATLFGAASSSCSYAAVALARSLFRKGASFGASTIFEIASANLVIELGLALIVLLGWQFMTAEIIGGILMIIILSIIYRFTLKPKLIQSAQTQTAKGVLGQMEGHAGMDMSIRSGKNFFQKLFSQKGFTAISHFYVMDWYSVWKDIALGFLIAGILAVFVPHTIWQNLFLAGHPLASFIIGPLVGPLIAIISFVCSVGNIPLAAVLWQGGISFGGVISFIFADLIILPILNIYRRYYGRAMMFYILGTFYIAMAGAGYIIEIIFSLLNAIPSSRKFSFIETGIGWNYNSILNIAFILLTLILIFRFFRTGGPEMLKMMEMPRHHEIKHHSS